MPLHKHLWTFLIVTVVTVLIWLWSAGETREARPINYGRVQFTVPDAANWVVTPPDQAVNISAQGSKLALQELEAALRKPLRLSVRAEVGRQSTNLLERLRGLDEIRETGVTITSVEPGAVDIDVDQIKRITVRVRPQLPGVTTEGEVVVDPPEVRVAIPSEIHKRLPDGWAVEAFVDRSELDRLEPGVRQSLEVKLRLPEGVSSNAGVLINPARVRLMFTARSRIRELKLDTVRIHLAGPPEDNVTYVVEIKPKQLANVTISADTDLIRRIETKEVPVFAMLHLSSRDKETIAKDGGTGVKRISHFMALVPESAAGSTPGAAPGAVQPVAAGIRGVQVQGATADPKEMEIEVTVRPLVGE